MTTETTTTVVTVEESKDFAVWSAAPATFEFGGRKRKGDKPAFAKLTRQVIWNSLPEESRIFAARYGVLQYLADGANTAEDDAAFAAAIDARLAKLTEADFTITRGDIAPTNDPEVLAKQLARQAVSGLAKEQKLTLTPEQRTKANDAFFAANRDSLIAEATAQIAKRKASAAAFDLGALIAPATESAPPAA